MDEPVSYTHLDVYKRQVQQGEYVVKGQPIARVGSTGNSTGNHCHFEIQVNGQWTVTRRYVMP